MTPDNHGLEQGSIVQINPEKADGVGWFGACLLVVDEVRTWGVQGYVKPPGQAGVAYYRAAFEDIEPTGGKIVWEASHAPE